MSKTSSILPVAMVAGLVFLAGTIGTAAAMEATSHGDPRKISVWTT